MADPKVANMVSAAVSAVHARRIGHAGFLREQIGDATGE